MFRPVLAIFKGAILEGTKAFAVVIVICPEPVLTSPGNVKAFVPFGTNCSSGNGQGWPKHVGININIICILYCSKSLFRPPLWSSVQSFWLQIQRSRVGSSALPDFLSSSGSGTGSTQPREVN